MKKILLLCVMLFALAANAQNVYRPYREFVYKVTVRCGDSVHTSYLSMWATDSAFEADASQRQLFYAYHDNYNKDSLAAAWPYKDRVECTGIIENDKKVWIHPPRSGEFAMLECRFLGQVHVSSLQDVHRVSCQFRRYMGVRRIQR